MRKIIYIIVIVVITLLCLVCNRTNKSNQNNLAYNKISYSDDKNNIINIMDTNYHKSLIKENTSSENEEVKEVLNYEAEKRNITLDVEQETKIEEILDKELSIGEKEKIKEIGVSEEEFKENLKKELILMQKRVKLKEKLISEINTNNISIDNIEFKEKVNDYNNNIKNNENSVQECLNLLNEYVELIQNNNNLNNN